MNAQQKAIVDTVAGKLEGVFENSIYQFKGVPYAEPPIGALRWMPPQPLKAWPGIRSAKAFGPIAPQDVVPVPGVTEAPEPQSEDCLYLNVYTPGLDNARRPVMVWIHGGAFSMGSGSSQQYSTGTLAQNQNVVLVTINYRLGILGFLNLNELTGGRIPSTGNEGLQDQAAALRWVRDNIALFGGDPDNVTIFGESAGAMSIGCLLGMPEVQGLFHRAILESPVSEMARPLDMSVAIAKVFLDLAGVRPDDIAAIKSLPIDTILRAQREAAARTQQGAAPVIPVADGIVLPRMPLDSLESGLGSKVPILIGTNLDEDKFFSMMNRILNKIDDQALQRTAARYVAERDVEKLIHGYRKARSRRGESIAPFEIFSAINTDVMFRKTAIRVAEAQCKHGAGGYNYLFRWKSPAIGGNLGACHAVEIGFVFGNYSNPFNGTGPEADRLSALMQDAWAAFARSGNPGCRSLGEWPPYMPGRATMVLDSNCSLERAVYEDERRVWDGLETLSYSNMP